MPGGMELGAESCWRVFDSSPTRTASVHKSRALRLTGRRAEWRILWSFAAAA